ncbi:GFA family protein [Massilia sp. MB5]|uniref:GFA family protein n=1 Tax=Massilia sp. MB5 TaxID=2919578 RepID=UPI001F10C557|nr:GFA family protein [Massilia sp. MB5]UMR28858.1 GFA family protein [Massilia sp. MB5]
MFTSEAPDYLRGSCLCGGIRYRMQKPVRYACHCYCTMCRKQHGAAAGSYAVLPSANVVFERGAELVTEYASSEQGRRGFCSVCGSTLFWRSTQTPQTIAITLGTLDQVYDGPVEQELHTDTKPAWLPLHSPE